MSKFVTKKVEAIKARELVEQLYIDDVGQLDALENSLAGTTYNGEFIGLLAFIQHFANGGNPGKKVKYLKGKKDITEFEFISKHLRIYAIQEPGKKIIIYGGFKRAADSSDNIAIFRRILDSYLNSKDQQNEKGKTFKK
jgi:hypothetical protein